MDYLPARILTATSAAALAVVLCSGLAAQGDAPAATSAADRAEAHKTIMRRLSTSGKAKTARLGLSQAATRFVDLYLDLERNRAEIRAGKAPRSRRFGGTPHQLLRVEGDQVYLAAAFVTLVIDEARMPIAEVPALFLAVTGPGFEEHATVSTDTKQGLADARMNLLHYLHNTAAQHCEKDPKLAGKWAEAKKKTAALALESVHVVSARNLMAPLDLLKRLGDDDAARVLIKMYDDPPADAPRYLKGSLIRAISGMRCACADDFFVRILKTDDQTARRSLLGMISHIPGEKAKAALMALFDAGSQGDRRLWPATIRALGSVRSPSSIEILRVAQAKIEDPHLRSRITQSLITAGDTAEREKAEAAFAKMKNGPRKLELAKTLASAGSLGVAPYLRTELAGLEKAAAGDTRARFQANTIKRLLKKLEDQSKSK